MQKDGTEDIADDLLLFETPDEAFQYIRYAGMVPDDELDIGETALALALVSLPGVNPERYRHHVRKLKNQLAETHDAACRQAADTLELRVRSLVRVVHEMNDYHGDPENYDDLQNMNFIRMVDRRRGLPVALGVLYVALGAHMGWDVAGLNFPGHALVRLEQDGGRVILDPFHDGREMDAAALRDLLKSIVGKDAELSHRYYETVTKRDMLVRLQNNVKTRLIDAEDYAQAVVVVEAMEALAPAEYRILFDKAILYAKLAQMPQAVAALESYIEKTPDPRERHQAQMVLQQIKAQIRP